MSLSCNAHRMQVIALYRRLLGLHKRLPPAFSDIGTKFVREEFKKHKDSRMEHAIKFMQAWTVFADTLEAQLNSGERIGENLSSPNFDLLNSHQITQLRELHKETTKTSVH